MAKSMFPEKASSYQIARCARRLQNQKGGEKTSSYHNYRRARRQKGGEKASPTIFTEKISS
jgi:hypothetical protein